MKFIMLLALILSFAAFEFGQEKDDETQKSVCFQPFSYKFDEFKFTTMTELQEYLKPFVEKIKTSENSKGFMFIYAGQKTSDSQANNIGFKTETYLAERYKLSYDSFKYSNGGYRTETTVELFIKPLVCSETPEPTPTLEIENVEFIEENELPKDVIRKPTNELTNLLLKRVEPFYPVAARAVRAMGKVVVLIVIDENGKVTQAKAIDGHPLLRAASVAAVRQWEFQSSKANDKPIKIGGKVIVEFKPKEEENR